MKKTLLIVAAAAALSTSALADSNTFYLRADVGANKFTQQKIRGHKTKSNISANLDLGVGYKLMDTVRVEFVYTHHFSPEAKASWTQYNRSHTVKNKGKIDALMVRGYVDVYEAGPAVLFVGAGAGLAQVKEATSYNSLYNSSRGKARTGSFGKKNNFAYSIMAGAGFGVAPGVYLDLQGSWNDFGKAKNSSVKRRSFAGSAGVRLEL